MSLIEQKWVKFEKFLMFFFLFKEIDLNSKWKIVNIDISLKQTNKQQKKLFTLLAFFSFDKQFKKKIKLKSLIECFYNKLEY